jgi:N-acetylglucosamine-6-phosphate deacetylase
MDLHLENGRLVNTEGSLAGAHVTMAESVARLVAVVGVPVVTALRMGITIPARVIGAPELAQVGGRATDEVMVLDARGRLVGSLAEQVVAA